MNYDWQNQQPQTNEDRAKPATDKLELFAEEMPVQHDLRVSATVGTGSTIGTIGSTTSTLGTVSTGM